jgi:hypothetical protein
MENTNRLLEDVSPDMAILIRSAQAGGATKSGDIIVPPHLMGWAREILRRATPSEMKILDDAIQANFH